jgi:hypothetical protein
MNIYCLVYEFVAKKPKYYYLIPDIIDNQLLVLVPLIIFLLMILFTSLKKTNLKFSKLAALSLVPLTFSIGLYFVIFYKPTIEFESILKMKSERSPDILVGTITKIQKSGTFQVFVLDATNQFKLYERDVVQAASLNKLKHQLKVGDNIRIEYFLNRAPIKRNDSDLTYLDASLVKIESTCE